MQQVAPGPVRLRNSQPFDHKPAPYHRQRLWIWQYARGGCEFRLGCHFAL